MLNILCYLNITCGEPCLFLHNKAICKNIGVRAVRRLQMKTGCKTWNACSAGSTEKQTLKSVKQKIQKVDNPWFLKGQKSAQVI